MYIHLIKGDTGIGRRASLSNENGPVDLTDTNEVRFLFDNHVIYPIKEEEKGKLLLPFNEFHTAKAGVFNASFKVTFKDGRKETFPGAESPTRLKVYVKE